MLKYGDKELEIAGGNPATTNNRMELTAAIEALRRLNRPCTVQLYSDSRYLVDGMSKGWAKGWKSRGWKRADKSPALNPELWDELLSLTAIHNVAFHWVRGHTDNPYNNRCDELARAAIEKSRG